MPNNKRHTAKQIKGKDKLHPGSRKAGQLDRIHLRADKLKVASKLRSNAAQLKLAVPLFFLSSLPSDEPLSLESFKELIAGTYLERFDEQIAELDAARRKGRPKEGKQLELEEKRRREVEEWKGSGIEVPDLTDLGNARLIKKWRDEGVDVTAQHLDAIRVVRVTESCEAPLLVRKGKANEMGLVSEAATGKETMETDA